MTRTNTRKNVVTLVVTIAAIVLGTLGTGCDDYVEAGDFMTPTVEPMDFSPYGYDYSVYDLLTGDE